MKTMSNNLLPIVLAMLLTGAACAVERPRPPVEERVKVADLVIVADGIQKLPKTNKEFDKFFRVQARVAGVLKGPAKVGDHVEVVVDNTISELRNNCCEPGKVYVLFLRRWEGKYAFVGSPLGAVPVELLGQTLQPGN